MKMTYLAVIAALGLAGCVEPTQTSLQARPGQTAQQAVDSLVRTRAIALAAAATCRRQGITLRDTDFRGASERDVRNLVKQGYQLPDLLRAYRNANKNKRLTRASVRYLESRGVQRNNPASMCTYARREMAAGTAVGRLLKKV